MTRSLADWLSWQETLHPRSIDLGLERVTEVLRALDLATPPFKVITVGGTNGKGSCVAWLTAFLAAAGERVGTFTSPHLARYNERIAVDGADADDAALCAAFEAIDRARGATSLTYFEFSALAALHVFRDARCGFAVLEVGLGGRLDATNAVDADVAVVVSVGIDHTDWLGPDREAIGFEKAGIYRAGRPAVCADPAPPASLVAHAAAIGAQPVQVGRDYRYAVHADGRWDYDGVRAVYRDLPAPCLPGAVQYGNAAAALAALDALPGRAPPSHATVVAGLGRARLRARFERIAARPDVIVDVTHNPDGARVLAAQLSADRPTGRTYAVCGMLADKAIAATLAELDRVVDEWLLAPLQGPRGARAEELAARAAEAGVTGRVTMCDSVASALARARALASPQDRIIVFGSFLTAAAAL